MIGSNSSARLSCTGTVKLGVWVFACLLWIAGPQVKAQDGQHQVPNAPGTNTADASQNGTSAPTPQQPDEGNPPPSSLKLPNLLQNVTPGEGAPPPANTSSSGASAPAAQPAATPAQQQPAPASNGPAPVIPPKGQGPAVATYILRTRVNFVQVPVTVKDSHGAILPGLTHNDFQIYEDGVQQRITFFSEDPFPLSVAFVVDQDLPSDTMKKVNDALAAFQGAFAPYDEVSVYTYATHVSQATGFTGAQSARLTATLDRVKSPGRYMEVPSNTGPMAEGPTINGQMVDPNVTPTHDGNFIGIIPKENYVLNDAILRAATDLSQRGRRTAQDYLRHQRRQEPGEHGLVQRSREIPVDQSDRSEWNIGWRLSSTGVWFPRSLPYSMADGGQSTSEICQCYGRNFGCRDFPQRD